MGSIVPVHLTVTAAGGTAGPAGADPAPATPLFVIPSGAGGGVGAGLVGTEVETRFMAAAFFAADLPDTFAAAGFFLVAAFVTCFRLAAATGLGVFFAALTGFGVLAAFTTFFFAGAGFLSEVFAPDFAGLLFEAAFLALIGLGFDFEATFFLAII